MLIAARSILREVKQWANPMPPMYLLISILKMPRICLSSFAPIILLTSVSLMQFLKFMPKERSQLWKSSVVQVKEHASIILVMIGSQQWSQMICFRKIRSKFEPTFRLSFCIGLRGACLIFLSCLPFFPLAARFPEADDWMMMLGSYLVSKLGDSLSSKGWQGKTWKCAQLRVQGFASQLQKEKVQLLKTPGYEVRKRLYFILSDQSWKLVIIELIYACWNYYNQLRGFSTSKDRGLEGSSLQKGGSDARGDLGVVASFSECFYLFFLRKILGKRVLSLDSCEVAQKCPKGQTKQQNESYEGLYGLWF